MRSTISMSFYCRASKANKQGLSPIELSLSVNNQRRFINLPYKCTAREFNKKRRPEEIEAYLSAIRNNLNDYIYQLAEQKKALTVDSLMSLIRTGGVKTYTINDLFTDYLSIQNHRVGIDMDIEFYRKYELTRDIFYTVADKDREAATISNADILKFKNAIAQRMQESTAAGYLSRLKAFVKYGMNNGKINTDPFAGIKIRRKEKPVQTITNLELQAIINKQFSNDRLNKVKDLFLLACGTGLAFADIRALQPTDFQEKDGKIYINKQRQKTGVKFFSVLLPFAANIIKKYNYDLTKLKLSNQKCNSYLKEIQDLCNITSVDSLHYHLGRHYYATNAINSGVPLEIVQKLVGHSNIKQTQHYARLMEDTILDKVGDLLRI